MQKGMHITRPVLAAKSVRHHLSAGGLSTPMSIPPPHHSLHLGKQAAASASCLAHVCKPGTHALLRSAHHARKFARTHAHTHNCRSLDLKAVGAAPSPPATPAPAAPMRNAVCAVKMCDLRTPKTQPLLQDSRYLQAQPRDAVSSTNGRAVRRAVALTGRHTWHLPTLQGQSSCA